MTRNSSQEICEALKLPGLPASASDNNFRSDSLLFKLETPTKRDSSPVQQRSKRICRLASQRGLLRDVQASVHARSPAATEGHKRTDGDANVEGNTTQYLITHGAFDRHSRHCNNTSNNVQDFQGPSYGVTGTCCMTDNNEIVAETSIGMGNGIQALLEATVHEGTNNKTSSESQCTVPSEQVPSDDNHIPDWTSENSQALPALSNVPSNSQGKIRYATATMPFGNLYDHELNGASRREPECHPYTLQ